MKTKQFECGCHTDEHHFKIMHDREHDELMLTVHLNHYHRWYKRIWIAILYALGKKSRRYGDYSEVLIQRNDVPALQELLSDYMKSLEGLKSYRIHGTSEMESRKIESLLRENGFDVSYLEASGLPKKDD